jgi:hypothetical protein
MQIVNLCEPWKIANGAETLLCRRCNVTKWVSAANFQAGVALVYTDVMRALWRVDFMLALNCSFLNREYTLMNVLKALASIISMCTIHVTLSKVASRYFALFINGTFRPINVRQDSGG